MKRVKKVLILISVIVFVNYIIHLPMCVDDYVHKDSDIYSAQHMCRQAFDLDQEREGNFENRRYYRNNKNSTQSELPFCKSKNYIRYYEYSSVPLAVS